MRNSCINANAFCYLIIHICSLKHTTLKQQVVQFVEYSSRELWCLLVEQRIKFSQHQSILFGFVCWIKTNNFHENLWTKRKFLINSTFHIYLPILKTIEINFDSERELSLHFINEFYHQMSVWPCFFNQSNFSLTTGCTKKDSLLLFTIAKWVINFNFCLDSNKENSPYTFRNYFWHSRLKVKASALALSIKFVLCIRQSVNPIPNNFFQLFYKNSEFVT